MSIAHLARPWVRSALLVSALFSPALHAQVALSGTNTLVTEVRTDNKNGKDDDDNYAVLIDRLNLGLSAGPLSTTARLDTNLFASAPSDAYTSQTRLERLNVTWTWRDLELVGGDFYQILGRGIALNVRKLNEAGVDIAIQGARAAWQGEHFGGLIFAGQANPQNIDSINQRFVEDPHDLLAGAQGEMNVLGLHAGAFGVALKPSEQLLDREGIPFDFTANAGGFAEVPDVTDLFALPFVDAMSVYVEGLGQLRRAADSLAQGYGAYGLVESQLHDLALVTEAMVLRDFDMRGSRNSALQTPFLYNQPPTLERIDQLVVNSRDVAGVRQRAEYYLTALNLLLYANGMARINDFRTDSEVYQLHAYGGVALRYGQGHSRLGLAVGVRDERPEKLLQGRQFLGMTHLDVDLLHQLWPGIDFHFTSNSQFWRQDGRPFQRGSTLVGLESGGVYALTFEFGYDTQNASLDVNRFYYALIAQLHLTENTTFRGTAGTQRGGIKCVAGICREYPAFSGVQGVVVTTF